MEKIGIVGCGAVGGYYGGMLARHGLDIHFLLRSDFDEARANGFTIRRGSEIFSLPVNSYQEPADIGQCDLVIIALKSTANNILPKLLSPLVGDQTMLLTLQNGLGNIELLQQLYPDNHIAGGLCFVCINRVAPATFENYFPGYIEMGEAEGIPTSNLRKIASWFQDAISDCRIVDPLQEALWRKLCWNIPFNGLSIAAGGITTDKILADSNLVERAWILMREIQSASPHSIPDDFLQRQFDNTGPMGAYRPSSLIDFLASRPVEVEAIWGNPLQAGKERGIPMPELEKLYLELKLLCP